MTGDDLKHMQDGFLDAAKKILRMDMRLRPVGFVVTMHKHLDKLAETGWGVEFLDFGSRMSDDHDDAYAVLILDMAMDWKRQYHAVVSLMPEAVTTLEPLLKLAEKLRVDDPHMRVMRPFLAHVQMDTKDVVAATMRHVCDKVDAFACVMQHEAWLRVVGPTEDAAQVKAAAAGGLGGDAKAVEVIASALETHDFARTVTVPIRREPSDRRDGGKVLDFGEPMEAVVTPDDPRNKVGGRYAHLLKPLPEAS